MTSISNGESGSDVRTKLNSSLAVTDAFTVSNGNVGIGVTPSAWSLGKAIQIGSTGSQLLLADNTGTSYFGTNWYYDGSFRYKDSSFAASYNQQNNGIHVWNTAPSGTAGAAITFTQSMTLNASGNLGIGTASPNAASIVDAQSTTKGVRFPNMTTTQKNAIANVAGNVVFDTTLGKLCVNSGLGWQTITSV